MQATICSCLKYFGQATIGVARDYDRDIMNELLKNMVIKSSGRPMLDYIHVSTLAFICFFFPSFLRCIMFDDYLYVNPFNYFQLFALTY